MNLHTQLPYECHTGRCEGSDSVPEVVISSEDADGLQRLSETHVVAQDPVQLVFVKK